MKEIDPTKCPVCKMPASIKFADHGEEIITRCPRCLNFIITQLIFSLTPLQKYSNWESKLSYWIRHNQSKDELIRIDSKNIETILKSIQLPGIKELRNNFIVWLAQRTDSPGEDVFGDMNIIASIIGAKDRNAVFFIASELNKKGLIKAYLDSGDEFQGHLTSDGWDEFEMINTKNISNEQRLNDSNNLSSVIENTKFNIKNILEIGESDKIEFKGSFSLDVNKYLLGNGVIEINGELALKGVMKTITAFLNSSGGQIVIGIIEKKQFEKVKQDKLIDLVDFDDFYIFGIDNEINKMGKDGYELKIRDMIQKHIAKDLAGLIKIQFENFRGKDLAILEIAKGTGRWYYLNDKFFVRDGNRTIELTNIDADNYKQRMNTTHSSIVDNSGDPFQDYNPKKQNLISVPKSKSNIPPIVNQTSLKTSDNLPRVVQPIPLRKKYRQIITELANEMERAYGDWLSSFAYNLLHKNKVYQQRDASITTVRNVWVIGEMYFNYAFGIYSRENKSLLNIKSDGILARFIFDKSLFKNQYDKIESILISNGYIKFDHPKEYNRFVKLFVDESGMSLYEINSENLKKIAFSELQAMRSFIEYILT